GRSGIDEVDAEIDRLMNEPRGFVLALAGLEAQPGEAAGAQPRDADTEAGAAEGGVVHGKISGVRLRVQQISKRRALQFDRSSLYSARRRHRWSAKERNMHS